ncbi:hypothetical protein Tco_0700735 [Tanacetum coccineum]
MSTLNPQVRNTKLRKTPSPPSRKKYLSPPHALFKSTSSRSTHCTSSASPKSYVAIHQRKENSRMMLKSIENGPLVYLTIEEDGKIHDQKYAKLTEQEKLQDKCDVQETNIVLQGLPSDVYFLVYHCKAAC